VLPKTRRRAILAAAVILLGTAVGLSISPLRNWVLKRLIVKYLSEATGQPCSIGRLRVAGKEMEILNLEVGAAPGAAVAVDRLVARGDFGKRRLDALTVERGTVKIQVPGRSAVRLHGVDLQATNLAALTGGDAAGPAAVMAAGDCFELNPLLPERGNTRLLGGRFILSCEVRKPAGGVLNQPVKVAFRELVVRTKDRAGGFNIDNADVEVTVLLTGTLADPKLDLRSIPFMVEPPPGRK